MEEEAKLVRMATAISQYTVSSMLQEQIQAATESINQAVHLLDGSPWVAEHIQRDLRRQYQELVQLEQSALQDKQAQALKVEDAQKDLMPRRTGQCQDRANNHTVSVEAGNSPRPIFGQTQRQYDANAQ